MCSTCGSAFISKTQLNLHLKQHHGVQSNKSKKQVCSFFISFILSSFFFLSFFLSLFLSFFLLCSMCGAAFISKTQLNLHLKQHHGVQSNKKKVRFLHSPPSVYPSTSLSCPPSKTQLNLHLKQHHGVSTSKKKVQFLQPLPTLLKSCPTLPSL